jgi:hypothetical protein
MEIMAANLRRVKAETRQRIQEELPINVRRMERREESALWRSARAWEGYSMSNQTSAGTRAT